MKRALWLMPILLVVVFASTACASGYHGYRYGGYGYYAPGPPPPPPAVVMYRAPGPGFVWIDGNWGWRDRWYWTPGRWVRPPRARAVWVPGNWYSRGHRYSWRPGYWR